MALDDAPEELNLTPYLDVLMNLIVFVLVSGAGLVTWGALPASTAGGRADHEQPAAVPHVHVSRAATTLDGSALTLDELPSRLARLGGRKLVLEAEPDVTLEQLVATMDAARKAHFDEVTLAD